MICYLDKTFCVSLNCENKCGRKLTDKVIKSAIQWWGSDDAPIAMSCFCGGDLQEGVKVAEKTINNIFNDGISLKSISHPGHLKCDKNCDFCGEDE